jgi:CheY-like chemotaxis protein
MMPFENDFHHRVDLFEPGDRTALVCVDVPEVQRLVVENLTELDYKIHTGLYLDDILLKMQSHIYDVLVMAEHFNASDLNTNPVLGAAVHMTARQRRRQIQVIVGSSMQTDSEMQAWRLSVDVVVGLADAPNLKHILRRTERRWREMYDPFMTVLKECRME